MPGRIKLQPGPPNRLWDSDGIRLRSQAETSLRSVGAHVRPTSGGSYFTYVHVENTGTDPIGPCACAATGPWRPATFFVDTPQPALPATAPDGRSRLVALSANQCQLEDGAGTSLVSGLGLGTGINRSFWSWSPDGLFFAFVRREDVGGSRTWYLNVFATRPYTRADGVVQVPAGQVFSSIGTSTALGVIAGSNIGWNAAATCLVLIPPPVPPGGAAQSVVLICPYADQNGQTAPSYTVFPAPQGQYLHSPCGHLTALVPNPPGPPPNNTQGPVTWIDVRRTAQPVTPTVDNLATQALVTAAGATITTTGRGRRGVRLTGMSVPAVDNLECLAGVPATVEVRRVRVSTMPNQTAIFPAGSASAAIWPGDSLWVEIPAQPFINPSPANQLHYCLQARGDAAPDDPAPAWANFDASARHFAQRNIAFA